MDVKRNFIYVAAFNINLEIWTERTVQVEHEAKITHLCIHLRSGF